MIKILPITKKGIEGIVILEIYVDETGQIKKINVLEDPGNGFAEAALNAFKDENGDYIKIKPAISNGKPVAVKFKYPVRFTLK